MARLILAFVVLMAGLVGIQRPVSACECPEDDGTPYLFGNSSATRVFRGQVAHIDWDNGSSDVHFSVQTVWKGPLEPETTVWTAAPSDQCGVDFVKGATYVVYVHENASWGERAHVSSCGPTRASTDEETYLLGFGPGTNVERPTVFGWGATIGLVAVGIVIATIMTVQIRRWRHASLDPDT